MLQKCGKGEAGKKAGVAQREKPVTFPREHVEGFVESGVFELSL